MSSARRKGRELALQALYQLEVTGDHSDRALALFFDSSPAGESAKDFALGLVRGILGKEKELDLIIDAAAANWRVERLSEIDRTVLRIATFEMTGPKKLPVEIAINEAIEIVRRYGTAESAKFVNGVLDRIAREHELTQPLGNEVAAKRPRVRKNETDGRT